jgi:hypothetical protein
VPAAPTNERTERARKPLHAPALPGEAFQNYYELAVLALDMKKDQERALFAWARQPSSAVPAAVASAQRANGRALLLLEQGASAEKVANDRRLNATLAQRAMTLGRLELARGRLELAGGAKIGALERGLAVLRLAEDVLASGTPEAAFLGAALEQDAAMALEHWLSEGGWSHEDVKAARERLVLVLESAAVPPKSEEAARVVQRANARVAALPALLDKIEGKLNQGQKDGRAP